jgi:glyoxylase-like metal-dependent hydrolase (beta-lactamase superfamily II)
MPVSRRQFIATTSIALGSLPFARLRAWQAAAPATRFETIRRNVGYFTGKGGTIGWLVNADAVVVVDTQFPDTAKLCLDGLGQKSPRQIDLLFNTHHHGDHTAGNGVFKQKTKKIVAHARVPELQKQFAAADQPAPVVADATFTDVWSEEAGNERVTARHHGPAHTGGDSIVHFEQADVAHMGDLLFHEMHPFVDRPGGASIQNWITVLETAMKMPRNTTFIAGHAKPGLPLTHDRTALQRQRDYFDAVLSLARKGIAAGQSKEELAKTETLAGFEGYHSAPPRLTLGFVLGVAHDELQTSRDRAIG